MPCGSPSHISAVLRLASRAVFSHDFQVLAVTDFTDRFLGDFIPNGKVQGVGPPHLLDQLWRIIELVQLGFRFGPVVVLPRHRWSALIESIDTRVIRGVPFGGRGRRRANKRCVCPPSSSSSCITKVSPPCLPYSHFLQEGLRMFGNVVKISHEIKFGEKIIQSTHHQLRFPVRIGACRESHGVCAVGFRIGRVSDFVDEFRKAQNRSILVGHCANPEDLLSVTLSDNFVLVGTDQPFQWISENHCFRPGRILKHLLGARPFEISQEECHSIGLEMWQGQVVPRSKGETQKLGPFRDARLRETMLGNLFDILFSSTLTYLGNSTKDQLGLWEKH
jgi:hypothetical protein